MLSNSTESTMPAVVRIATDDAAISAVITTRSTLFRARRFSEKRKKATTKPNRVRSAATKVFASALFCLS
jgi:hypothetical protein